MRDDPELQKSAAERDCPKLVIQLLTAVEAAEQSGDISNDLASKVKEVNISLDQDLIIGIFVGPGKPRIPKRLDTILYCR